MPYRSIFMEFRSRTVQKALKEAHQVAKAPCTEGEPFRSKYDAAQILADCRKILEVYREDGSNDEESISESLALVECVRGVTLLDTDSAAEGEADVAAGLPLLLQSQARFGALLQQVYNSLALMWITRDQLQSALELLQKSEAIYSEAVVSKTRRPAEPDSLAAEQMELSLGGLSLDQARREEAWWQSALGISQSTVDREHITTLFLLAQVYQQLHEHETSAQYCAATLQKQLQARTNADEWVRNCIGLVEYYTGKAHEFAVAEYLMHAATTVANIEGAVLESVLPTLKAEVALGWAAVYAKRLELSRQQRGSTSQEPVGRLDAVPANVRFQLPGLPEDSALPWGKAALATNYDGAKKLFQQALQHYQEGQKHFILSEYASRHCEIALSINNLYRDLVEFESDEHKQCVMHKARATKLEPLVEVLSARAYPSLYWSLRMEIANAYREIMLVKEDHKRPHSKIAAAARQAEVHLRAYLDAFGSSKDLPDRVAGVDQGDYVNCCYRLAQVLHKMQPPPERGVKPDLRCLEESTRLYRYAAGYIQRNKVVDSRMLEQPCKEMAELLDDKAKWIMMTSR